MQMGQFEVILFGILGVGFLGALCYLVYIAFIRVSQLSLYFFIPSPNFHRKESSVNWVHLGNPIN